MCMQMSQDIDETFANESSKNEKRQKVCKELKVLDNSLIFVKA